eukprot:CAMPEP_0168465756 /NCGR_PEP_ID=MMETSP0228-20121227/56286_1 /TAXON_ID=133427 /ORGANISM="Protoceratium reticulatum, Strain CCCM 535 (=CCMP 1889)" /LENGTH=36 /DNA_ID= /DNA_START= /DNA_END= /DNA_ORIENTATION=
MDGSELVVVVAKCRHDDLQVFAFPHGQHQLLHLAAF